MDQPNGNGIGTGAPDIGSNKSGGGKGFKPKNTS